MSSPELCFIQMAQSLTLAELIKLGFELCGTYGLPIVNAPNYDWEYPLTTPALIGQFIAAAGDMPGVKKARQALNYVLASSNSPRETATAMLLTLSLRLGGYGLPRPCMNYRIDPRKRRGCDTREKSYRCDLYWPEANIAIEYEGFEFHSGAVKMAEDAGRRNDLIEQGVTVVTIMKRQIRDLNEFGQIAQMIGERLGRRRRPSKRNWSEARHKLHGMLISSSRGMQDW